MTMTRSDYVGLYVSRSASLGLMFFAVPGVWERGDTFACAVLFYALGIACGVAVGWLKGRAAIRRRAGSPQG